MIDDSHVELDRDTINVIFQKYIVMNTRNIITLIVLVSVRMLLAVDDTFAQTTVKVGSLYYNLHGNEAEVTNKSGGEERSGQYYTESAYSVPSNINYNGLNYKVTVVGAYAFGSYSVYSHLYPFYASQNIVTITLPNSIKTIGKFAFGNCGNLTNINMPDSLETIGEGAFEYSSLTEVVMPATLKSIGTGAFLGCNILRNIYYVGINAPQGWYATSKTYVPDSVEYSNPGHTINNAHVIPMISFAKDTFEYTGNAPTTTWKNNVEGYSVKFNMPTLNSEIGNYKILIPATFTNGSTSFSVNIVYRYSISPKKVIGNLIYYLYGDSADVLSVVNPSANKAYNVPSSITIGSHTFNVIEIRDSAFFGSKASSITLPSTIEKIGAQAFGDCTNLEEIFIPKSVKEFASSPSYRVSGNPFEGCGNLKRIYYLGSTPPLNWVATTKTYIPSKSVYGTPTYKINSYSITEMVTFNQNTFTYTGQQPAPTWDNNVDNYSANASVPILNSKAGTFDAIIPFTFTNTNKSFEADIPFSYTIKGATLRVKANNAFKSYGEENPTFTVTYEGFVNGEKENVITVKPTVTTSATRESGTGNYTLYVSGGQADNYEFKYTNGTLTITKAYQQLTWDQNLNGIASYSQVRLDAVSSSGLPISYALDNDTVASLYKVGDYTYLDCFHDGKVTISAQQTGGDNYNPSPKLYKTAYVGIASGIKDISIIDGGNGYVTIADRRITISGLNNKEEAAIFTLSGALVYSGNNGSVTVAPGIYIIKVGGYVKKIVVK